VLYRANNIPLGAEFRAGNIFGHRGLELGGYTDLENRSA
jgi:hypothetical protein